MHDDDAWSGRVLSRREALGLLGAGGAAMLGSPRPLGGAGSMPFRLPACIVRPSQTEGPYFVDTQLDRSDIRSDPSDGSVSGGTPLRLAFQVSRVNASGCEPLPAALVDLWQCDALGIYSGVKDINGLFDTVGKRFLRGHQLTNADGMAHFVTVYPGWYRGRAVHVHFKIRTDPSAAASFDFTSQLYFDDSLTDRVLASEPYVKNEGRRPRNEDDGIFRSGGSQLLVDAVERGDGYEALFDVGLQID